MLAPPAPPTPKTVPGPVVPPLPPAGALQADDDTGIVFVKSVDPVVKVMQLASAVTIMAAAPLPEAVLPLPPLPEVQSSEPNFVSEPSPPLPPAFVQPAPGMPNVKAMVPPIVWPAYIAQPQAPDAPGEALAPEVAVTPPAPPPAACPQTRNDFCRIV